MLDQTASASSGVTDLSDLIIVPPRAHEVLAAARSLAEAAQPASAQARQRRD
jgi:hypothetical protein